MNPYVPVLRWKGAEIEAVFDLTGSQRQFLKPLFELIPKDFTKISLEREIVLRARDISYSWGWNLPCFVDLSLLESAHAEIAFSILDKNEHIAATITTPLNPALSLRALRESTLIRQFGMAVRLNALDLRQSGARQQLLDILGNLRLMPDEVDIIIDYRVITGMPGTMHHLAGMIESIAHWRSITFLSGAFPPDLSELERNNQYLLPRHDWLAYRRYALEAGSAGFGDYTIQHGLFEEREGKGLNFSASIRYTGPADWVIMRGESVRVKDGPGYQQYPANAQLLCERPEFCGAGFSAGDRYVKEMSLQSVKTGGPKEWLEAGINHHIAYVLYQLEHITETPMASAAFNEAAPDWPARAG